MPARPDCNTSVRTSESLIVKLPLERSRFAETCFPSMPSTRVAGFTDCVKLHDTLRGYFAPEIVIRAGVELFSEPSMKAATFCDENRTSNDPSGGDGGISKYLPSTSAWGRSPKYSTCLRPRASGIVR